MSTIRFANPAQPQCQSAVPAAPFVLPPAVRALAKPTAASEPRIARTQAKSAEAQAASNRRSVADREPEPNQTTDEPPRAGERLQSVNERGTPQDQPDQEPPASPPAGADASASVSAVQAAGEDFGLSDELAQMTDSGIFEVLLPNGETLGVAVDVRAAGIGFLLSPSCGRLRARLQMQKKELEGGLKRRMGCSVKIAVL